LRETGGGRGGGSAVTFLDLNWQKRLEASRMKLRKNDREGVRLLRAQHLHDWKYRLPGLNLWGEL